MAKQYLVSFSVYQRTSGSYSPLPSMSNAKTQIMADSTFQARAMIEAQYRGADRVTVHNVTELH